ncbi:hypothetical protein M5689_012856 [Euphorbia peplus]|nr:hypothetical protein M5689_012856 [Euphorbia peplus]
MKVNNIDVVSSSLWKKIPPKNGVKNRRIIESENPILLRKSTVETSSSLRISSSDFIRNPPEKNLVASFSLYSSVLGTKAAAAAEASAVNPR